MSRKAMKELIESGFPENTAVISFYDPNDGRGLARLKEYEPINYNGICDYVFTVGLHDIDIETLGDYGLSYETYFPEVEKLADFNVLSLSKEWTLSVSASTVKAVVPPVLQQ